nr:hypothetical protein [Pedobacter sp. ASV19]
MGTYLKTGIITRFSTSHEELQKTKIHGINPEETFPHLLVSNESAYKLEKIGNEYIWTLKPTIIEDELGNFVEEYHDDLYGSKSHYGREIQELTHFFKTAPTYAEIQLYLESIYNRVFCADNYRQQYINFQTQKVKCQTDVILLSNEAEVLYKPDYDHLPFFERAIRTRYLDFEIGGSLFVEANNRKPKLAAKKEPSIIF